MAHNLPEIQQKALTLRDYLHQPKIKSTIEESLPKWLSPERFLRVIFTATMKNPKLVQCTPESILQSVMQCAQLGLEPILGRAYLIPYNNSKLIGNKWQKVLECQFQPGYQGLIDLARRTDTIRDVYALTVYENCEFDLTFGTDRKIHHRPWYLNKENKEPGAIVGAYAVWEMKDGTKHPEFMPIADIYKRRDKSQAYKYAMDNPNNRNAQDCPWITWPEEMIIKTVIKHSSKLVPASIDFMQAVALDEEVDLGKSQMGMFTDNPEYDGLLPESSGSIDVTPKTDNAEQEETQAPKTHPAFAAIMKEQTEKDFEYVPTKDGVAHNLMSAYLEATGKNSKGMSPYEIMEMVSDPGVFPGFWNGFNAGTWKQHYEGKLPTETSTVKDNGVGPTKEAPSTTPTPKTDNPPSPPPDGENVSEETESINPFDIVDWDKSGLKGTGTERFWQTNNKEWHSASEKGKAGFKKKWIRVFSDKGGTLIVPIPWEKDQFKNETKPAAEPENNQNQTPDREPGDDAASENVQADLAAPSETESVIDYNGAAGNALFEKIQEEDPEGLIKACEAVGYGAQLVIPLASEARKKLHQAYLELKL